MWPQVLWLCAGTESGTALFSVTSLLCPPVPGFACNHLCRAARTCWGPPSDWPPAGWSASLTGLLRKTVHLGCGRSKAGSACSFPAGRGWCLCCSSQWEEQVLILRLEALATARTLTLCHTFDVELQPSGSKASLSSGGNSYWRLGLPAPRSSSGPTLSRRLFFQQHTLPWWMLGGF